MKFPPHIAFPAASVSFDPAQASASGRIKTSSCFPNHAVMPIPRLRERHLAGSGESAFIICLERFLSASRRSGMTAVVVDFLTQSPQSVRHRETQSIDFQKFSLCGALCFLLYVLCVRKKCPVSAVQTQ